MILTVGALLGCITGTGIGWFIHKDGRFTAGMLAGIIGVGVTAWIVGLGA
jgi:hypothetical protein